MQIIKGFGIILLFLALGECLSIIIGHFVPGSVIGMLLLFVALVTKLVKVEQIKDVAHFFTGNMTIFFIPSFMGIMDQWGIIKVSWLGWLGVIVVSTLLVMATSGYTVQLLVKRNVKKEEDPCFEK